MKDITVDQWKNQIAEDTNAVILDVRTQDEVDEGMIENALHIDIFLGQGFVDEIEKLTGIDFFPKLDDAIEQKLEASSDYKQWSFR